MDILIHKHNYLDKLTSLYYRLKHIQEPTLEPSIYKSFLLLSTGCLCSVLSNINATAPTPSVCVCGYGIFKESVMDK